MAAFVTAGARFFIGPVVGPDEIEAMAYADALAYFDTIPSSQWTEVREIESFGDIGNVSDVATFASVKNRRTRKLRTTRDGGTLTLVCGRDAVDAGQDALIDAEKTDFHYAFKIIYNDSHGVGQPGSLDYFGGTVLSRQTNLSAVADITKRTFGIGVNTNIVPAVRALGDWPWSDPETIADSEYTLGPKLYSGSLGVITTAQALTEVRAGNNHLAEDGDGKLMTFAANTPRITNGRGLWAETSGTCLVDLNADLTDASWVKVNCTITQDLPSPFAADSAFAGVPGCCINVTANGDATVLQTRPPFSGADECHPHARFYLPAGVTLNDDVEITQDGVLWTPVTDELVVDRWKQIGGESQLVTLTSDPLGVRLKNALAGDRLGFALANKERGYLMTTSIYTPGSTTVSRAQDITTMNLENYPPIYDLQFLTVFVVMTPYQLPLPEFLDPDHPRPGGTVLEINNPYDIVGTGIGELTPYGGAGEGSLLTLDSVSFGSFNVGDRLPVGTGVGSYTDITEQLTGTPGGAGTYRVFSTIYPDGQTTPTNITIQSRTKTAQGLALNWALKPDDPETPGVIRIGLTVTAEPDMVDFGNDPQTATLQLNEVNCLGFTIDLVNRTGWVALNGDTEPLNPVQFTHAPQFTSDLVVTVGSQYPSGGPTDGVVHRKVIRNDLFSQAAMAATSAGLQAAYS